ncbi:MAG: polysaccharide deacetylase family protein [Treponema sp.]|jgi:peptidoglycan/xylan/chitin deacetylase (PgdA/CDA1 family)|nr:polysaccharide deacetylase family protein [Treponema sp.]
MKSFFISLIICGIVLLGYSSCEESSGLQDESDEYEGGIILTFDDFHFTEWRQNGFPLFSEYDAKVVFFVDERYGVDFDFCRDAQDLGHEIGYHTIHHLHASILSVEDLLIEAVSHIPMFREEGIELTTFAYPYGSHSANTNNLLLNYYKVLRGTAASPYPNYHLYSRNQMKSGFVRSTSLDNYNHRCSDDIFESRVTRILTAAKDQKQYMPLITHNIGTTNDWGITLERLEFVLQKCRELELKFYTFKDLQ